MLIDVDSSIVNPEVADGNIQDPYGFETSLPVYSNDKMQNGQFMLEVFKDCQIIWTSVNLPGPQYYDYPGGEFLPAKDLNREGKVDIVAYFDESGPQHTGGDI